MRFFNSTLLLFLALSLVACEQNKKIPQPTEIQKKWMEQSWLEYIVEVNEPIDNLMLNKNKLSLSVVKVKRFTKTQFVITLNKKTKYKVIYNALMKIKNIRSIQPNFRYQIPKLEIK